MAGLSDEEVQEKLEESLGIKKKPLAPAGGGKGKANSVAAVGPGPAAASGGALRPAWLQSRRNQILAVAAAALAVFGAVYLLIPRGPGRGPSAVGAKLFEGEPHRIEGTDISLVFTKVEGRAAVDMQARSVSENRLLFGSILDPAVETGTIQETVLGTDLKLQLNAVHDAPPMPPWIDLTITHRPAAQQ